MFLGYDSKTDSKRFQGESTGLFGTKIDSCTSQTNKITRFTSFATPAKKMETLNQYFKSGFYLNFSPHRGPKMCRM